MLKYTMNNLVPNFKPNPGFILIDPLEKDTKSSLMNVVDTQDVPFKGTVLAVGDSYIDDKGNEKTTNVKVGDFVLYSIVGTEEFKMDFKDNKRYRLVISPFSRVLGVFTK